MQTQGVIACDTKKLLQIQAQKTTKRTEKMIGMIHTEIPDTYFIPVVIEVAAVGLSIHCDFLRLYLYCRCNLISIFECIN